MEHYTPIIGFKTAAGKRCFPPLWRNQPVPATGVCYCIVHGTTLRGSMENKWSTRNPLLVLKLPQVRGVSHHPAPKKPVNTSHMSMLRTWNNTLRRSMANVKHQPNVGMANMEHHPRLVYKLPQVRVIPHSPRKTRQYQSREYAAYMKHQFLRA